MGLLGKNSRTFRPEWVGRSNHSLHPETAKVRRLVAEQITNGVVGFTASQLNKLFADTDLPDDGKNGGRYRMSAYKFLAQRGWKKQTLCPTCVVCYSPAASPGQVADLIKRGREEFKQKNMAIIQDGAEVRKEALRQKRLRDTQLSRDKLREEILKSAVEHKDPLVAYVHRAAKVCGVVRGYQWP
ncbi:MAG: hypothetical protein U0K42_11960 [Bacteroidales bacterium]|nr:hypothetical protein [Bacteroidales bacterium]